METNRKKKSKKRKNSDKHESLESHELDENETNDVLTNASPIKKKKNKSNNDNNMNESSNRTLDETVDQQKNKKKTKNIEDSLVNTTHDELELNDAVSKIPVDEDADDNLDAKKKRKKKKKKKKMSDVPAGPGKKSIRRMKWEKHCQRQADEKASAKDQLKTQTLSYLSQWKHDRPNWKFMKARQVWLYKTKFSPTYIPNESWPVLLEYFESCQGNIRKMLLDDANKVIAKMDEFTEKNAGADTKESEDEGADGDNPESDKPDSVTYKRARDLIQCLQE